MSCLLDALHGASRLSDITCTPGATAQVTYCDDGLTVIEVFEPVAMESSGDEQ